MHCTFLGDDKRRDKFINQKVRGLGIVITMHAHYAVNRLSM